MRSSVEEVGNMRNCLNKSLFKGALVIFFGCEEVASLLAPLWRSSEVKTVMLRNDVTGLALDHCCSVLTF